MCVFMVFIQQVVYVYTHLICLVKGETFIMHQKSYDNTVDYNMRIFYTDKLWFNISAVQSNVHTVRRKQLFNNVKIIKALVASS